MHDDKERKWISNELRSMYFYLNFIGLQKIFNPFGGEWLKTLMRMAATKMSRAETQRRKEIFLFLP
jgi:hypothetical protein